MFHRVEKPKKETRPRILRLIPRREILEEHGAPVNTGKILEWPAGWTWDDRLESVLGVVVEKVKRY